MAVVATKIAGVSCIGKDYFMATYKVLMDSSFLATGEVVDLTDDFSEIYDGSVGAVDAIADAAYIYRLVVPSHGTAIASTTVKLSAHYSPSKTGATEAAEAFAVADGVDLSTVGELRFTVWGKANIT